jgi:hypothetical protein
MCCQVEVCAKSWSLTERSPTECGVSECDREVSTVKRPWHIRGCCAIKMFRYIYIYIYVCVCVCVCVCVHKYVYIHKYVRALCKTTIIIFRSSPCKMLVTTKRKIFKIKFSLFCNIQVLCLEDKHLSAAEFICISVESRKSVWFCWMSFKIVFINGCLERSEWMTWNN